MNVQTDNIFIIFLMAVLIGAGFRLGWSLIGGIIFWFAENDRKFQQARKNLAPPTTNIPSA